MKSSTFRLRDISPMQILLLMVLTVALYFGAAFAGELVESQSIAQQVAGLNSEIKALQTQNEQIGAAVRDARTDTFVEREARDKLGMVRPGDVPVVFTNTPATAAVSATAPPPAPLAHWQKWLAALSAGA